MLLERLIVYLVLYAGSRGSARGTAEPTCLCRDLQLEHTVDSVKTNNSEGLGSSKSSRKEERGPPTAQDGNQAAEHTDRYYRQPSQVNTDAREEREEEGLPGRAKSPFKYF